MSPAEMVQHKEESEEFGGYFIVNGLEKLIRFLIVSKRNYPLAILRNSFANRGDTYTTYGVQIRCVRPDQTSQTNVLHYLQDGNVTFRFSWRKSEYLVPVMMILKALTGASDRTIFERIVGSSSTSGLEDKQFVIDRVERLLRTYKNYGLMSQQKARQYLGSKFKPVLGVVDDMDDEEAGTQLLRKIVLPHLGSNNVKSTQDSDKFNMLVFMIRKLYALAAGECAEDNPDAVSNQELLVGGHFYGQIIKEKLEEWLYSIKPAAQEWCQAKQRNFLDPDFLKELPGRILKRTTENIGQLLEYFLSTGNLSSPSGLDLQQTNGFTVLAEKLNFYRFISHFRCVHRGSFFAQLKTTTVRKLLPESWGYLCPVHTPDGGPCGLLNHLAHKCKIAIRDSDTSYITDIVRSLNVANPAGASMADTMVVQLDGRVIGFCNPRLAKSVATKLRYWKVEGSQKIPKDLEIGYIPSSHGGQYPGIYMFGHACRMYRPVKYLPLEKLDYVGPFEQPYMSIACTEPEIVESHFTHVEYDPTNILSIVANQTPFSDFNQSPRNMYQCLSADHEVLTKTGWKAIATIDDLDQVMTMDLQSGIQQWSAVQSTTRLAHDGPLYRLKSNGLDAVCNENHRWYLNTKDRPNTYTAYTTQQMMDTELIALRNASGKSMGQWDRKSSTTTHLNHKIPTVGRNGNAPHMWPDCPWLPRAFVTDDACNLDWCRFIGLVMGDGGIKHITHAQGGEYYSIQIHQCVGKPVAKAYIEDVLERLADKLPGFVVNKSCVTGVKEKHTWTINHRGMYDFFLPMVRGPQSFNPVDDAMCRTYQAHHYQASSSSGNEHVLPVPSGWETGNWWFLRRWFYYSWLFLLARDQARAMIGGIAAAAGEWALLVTAQSSTSGGGRRDNTMKKTKLSFETAGPEGAAVPLTKRGVVRVFNSSIPLLHDLSVLGLLADTRVNFEVNHSKGEWIPSIGSTANATGWRISFAFADSELTVAAPKPDLYDNPRHDGYVYCVTVANGNFLARRSIEYSDNDKVQEVLVAAQKSFYTGNCQMGKQTMGTAATAMKYRTDNKMYRLQTGQTPVVRPPLHNEYGLDNFPSGTNAVVAVISYTGYDMDDAMILNKNAHERGFGFGTIYKTKKIELEEDKTKSRSARTVMSLFGFAPTSIVKSEWRARLDDDGLPHVGQICNEGDIIAAYHSVSYDAVSGNLINSDGRTQFHRYKESETAFVEAVRILGSEDGTAPCHTISIKFRIPRSPVIGDKFSSRHGQKGVCSQKWPTIDMPFSESGIVPDVIINPHAFPSRMTIGMFVESLAGKSGCLHGIAQDSTPFKFEDKKGNTAVEFFGHQLEQAGYNYYGNEPMYSGITGQELAADIYIGVVYYQRLRHMVNDKYQVRTTGPVNQMTGQPVKGRSKGGGIRVGEMERDALLAHGTAFLLQDRLLNCSDYTKSWVCRSCGSFLSTMPTVGDYGTRRRGTGIVRCRRCASRAESHTPKSEVWEDGSGIRWTGGDDTTVVAVPGVLKYLDVEMAAMGVRMKFRIKP